MDDLLGWAAAALMLGTFACRDMLPLRILALGASAAFIAWAWQVQLMPVLALHAVLLPVHGCRLASVLAGRSMRRRAAPAGRPCATAARPSPEVRGPPRDADLPSCVCLAEAPAGPARGAGA